MGASFFVAVGWLAWLGRLFRCALFCKINQKGQKKAHFVSYLPKFGFFFLPLRNRMKITKLFIQ